MRLQDILLIRESEGLKFKREDWCKGRYVSKVWTETCGLSGGEYILINDLDNIYNISTEDVLADDWEIYNPVCYAALYTTDEGLPAMYIISEEEFNNKQWPSFPYVTDWIRFEGE